MNKTYLRQLLLSRRGRLLITAEGLASMMTEAFPPVPETEAVPLSFFYADPPTYRESCSKALDSVRRRLKASSLLEDVTLTDEFDSPELPENSIAYHRVWGIITASSKWYFSTKRFESDLKAAEANPSIVCHFIHANSPGGEAWYLDRLSETMRSLQKPVITLYEHSNCSACYYITCHSDYMAATTGNDFVGCIGTMADAYDFDGYYEKLGIKHIQVRSSLSDLKNKKYDDLKSGKPSQYVEDVLDPLARQFIDEVRACRPAMASLPDDDPALRGETYYTPEAMGRGLCDGRMTLEEAVEKAVGMGGEYARVEREKKRALNYL